MKKILLKIEIFDDKTESIRYVKKIIELELEPTEYIEELDYENLKE